MFLQTDECPVCFSAPVIPFSFYLAAVGWETLNLRTKEMVREAEWINENEKYNFLFFLSKKKRGKVITVIVKVENQHFYPLNRHVTAMRLSNVCCAVILLPCDLVTGRKRAMCVDGLLQLLFFGSSAVAKLENKTKVTWSFPLKC